VGSCGQTSLLRRLAGQQHLRLTGVGAIEHQVHGHHRAAGVQFINNKGPKHGQHGWTYRDYCPKQLFVKLM